MKIKEKKEWLPGLTSVILTHRLSGSTLVEILAAMVILIGVFSVGIGILVRIEESSKNWRNIEIQSRLREIRLLRDYQMSLSDTDERNDDLGYHVEVEKMDSYSDRVTVKIYAIDIRHEIPIDSLVYIEEINE